MSFNLYGLIWTLIKREKCVALSLYAFSSDDRRWVLLGPLLVRERSVYPDVFPEALEGQDPSRAV